MTCKSVKAIYSFSHQIKLTYLTANKCGKCRSSHEKNTVVNTAVQNRSGLKYSILGD